MKKKIVSLFLAAACLAAGFSGCSGKNNSKSAEKETALAGIRQMEEIDSELETAKIDDKYGTTYEIFVRSFYDSDGNGLGDLKGVEEKLDYLAKDTGLGVDGIWLMPVCPAASYHKYDVTDYENIDSDYGSLGDFKSLVKACHGKNIKLYIDFVMNHSSDQHPWFQTAKKYLEEHPGIDFTNVMNVRLTRDGNPAEVPEGEEKKELSESFLAAIGECPEIAYYNFSNKKENGCEKLSGTEYYYEARFWGGMPDFNLRNEKLRDEFEEIAAFWLDLGVDGFRLDAAKEYISNSTSPNVEILTWFNDMVKEKKPDAYIVAEVWDGEAVYSSYLKSGIDSCFDFAFADGTGLIAKIAKGNKGAESYGRSCKAVEKMFHDENPNAVDAPFYVNHDMNRSASLYSDDKAEIRTKLAQGLNLLMQGNAFLYYGEEIGMKGSGKDENKRLPMRWGGDGEGTTKEPPSAEKMEQPYPALSEQDGDPASVYSYVKNAISLRNAFPVIARGDTEPDDKLSGDGISVIRKKIPEKVPEGMSEDVKNAEEVAIIINNSEETRLVDIDGEIAGLLLTGNEKAEIKDGKLSVPSFGIVVLKEK